MTITLKQKSDIETKEKPETSSQEDPVITCRVCNYMITRPDNRITVGGAFSHAFANPHGHVFEIGCFDRAPGCVAASSPSSEFTWFKGYVWTIGVCAGCASHLGWIFTLERPDQQELSRFHGLILDTLIFP